jgi:hypothetical protein
MRQILGVWGQSPRKHVLPPHTAFLSRAPSHNACIALMAPVDGISELSGGLTGIQPRAHESRGPRRWTMDPSAAEMSGGRRHLRRTRVKRAFLLLLVDEQIRVPQHYGCVRGCVSRLRKAV